MYPTIPVGPLALPTGPFLTIIAAVIGLEMMGRYGRRDGHSVDALWNVGLVALLTGLVVARLWNVSRFWEIYLADPLLIVSIRPGGFVLLPGIIGGLIGGYFFMIYRALEPGPVVASAMVGLVAGSVIQGISGYLTGEILGISNGGPALLNPLDPLTQPAGLYRAVGMLLLLAFLWIGTSARRPLHTLAVSLLGYGLIRLIADGFVANSQTIAGVRISQLLALVGALVACVLLSQLTRTPSSAHPPSTTSIHERLE
ncbi:MAG: prolipoprotein diacylglyceryl transferase family protein [Chloroflexota bacterium]